MSGTGYLARLALQSGVAVRGAPVAWHSTERRAAPSAGIEVVGERLVAPPHASPPSEPVAPAERVAAVAPARGPSLPPLPLDAVPERRREPDEDTHPVVRVGEGRRSPAVAIDEGLFATTGDQARAEPSMVAMPRVAAPQSAGTADAAMVPSPTTRLARALADVRRWVSETPAPGELTRPAAVVPAEETSVAAPSVARREHVVAVAPRTPTALSVPTTPAAHETRELHVSIGRIEVVIDAPTPPVALPPRLPAAAVPPLATSGATAPMRRLSRHYLRG